MFEINPFPEKERTDLHKTWEAKRTDSWSKRGARWSFATGLPGSGTWYLHPSTRSRWRRCSPRRNQLFNKLKYRLIQPSTGPAQEKVAYTVSHLTVQIQHPVVTCVCSTERRGVSSPQLTWSYQETRQARTRRPADCSCSLSPKFHSLDGEFTDQRQGNSRP